MIQGNLALEKSAVSVNRTRTRSGMISVGHHKVKNRIQALAEAVILQAIEDLFESSEIKKSIDFFKGENFTLCAETAGLSTLEQMRIIRMLAKAGFQQYLFEVHDPKKNDS